VAARFDPAHLAGQILVVAATDDLEVNALVYQSATERGLFVNLVDDPERSSFIFPPSSIAAPSWWPSPAAARPRAGALLRERLESLLPRHLGGLAELSGRVRSQAKQVLASLSDRRRFWERAFASNTLAGLIEKADWQGAEQWLNEGLDKPVPKWAKWCWWGRARGSGPADPQGAATDSAGRSGAL
jgi:uroporphyrin-III C-methyltransferase/precorrin-2 dehydrogenase/sirohydrochlorin ferrochelatase